MFASDSLRWPKHCTVHECNRAKSVAEGETARVVFSRVPTAVSLLRRHSGAYGPLRHSHIVAVNSPCTARRARRVATSNFEVVIISQRRVRPSPSVMLASSSHSLLHTFTRTAQHSIRSITRAISSATPLAMPSQFPAFRFADGTVTPLIHWGNVSYLSRASGKRAARRGPWLLTFGREVMTEWEG
jgi:hypothetical protein